MDNRGPSSNCVNVYRVSRVMLANILSCVYIDRNCSTIETVYDRLTRRLWTSVLWKIVPTWSFNARVDKNNAQYSNKIKYPFRKRKGTGKCEQFYQTGRLAIVQIRFECSLTVKYGPIWTGFASIVRKIRYDLKNWLNRNRTINILYLCNLGDIDSIIDNGEYYAAWV